MTRESIPFYAAPDVPALNFDPFLAHAQAQAAITRIRMPCGDGEAECWLVTGYEEVRSVTADPRFSRDIVGKPFPSMNRHLVPLDKAVSFADPPDHARIRAVVAPAFSQPRVARLRARTQTLVEQLLMEMEAEGAPADLVRHVVSPLPLTLTGEILGIPESDRDHIRTWAQTLLTRPANPQDIAPARQARQDLQDYVRALAADRHRHPQSDLMTTMTQAVDAGRIDDDELIALACLVAVNGWHAMRNILANMAYLLLTQPHLMTLLRQQYRLAPQAVEELLRWIPHKNGIGQPRIATEDIEVGGVLIRTGEYVYVSYVAANWDDHAYHQPQHIDLHRQGPPHMAFGHGPHFCMGPALARMEAEILLTTLPGRFPSLRLAIPAAQVQWQTSALIRGPVALPVTW